MKNLVTLALMLVTTLSFAQKRVTVKGSFDPEKYRSEYFDVAAVTDDQVIVIQGDALDGYLNVSTRFLAVNIVDKNTLETVKQKRFEDISFFGGETKFIDYWYNDGTIYIIVSKTELLEYRLLEIDVRTLELKENRDRLLFSIAKQYNENIGELSKKIERKIKYRTRITKSENGEYIHFCVNTWGKDVKAKFKSLLLNKNGKVEHESMLDFATEYADITSSLQNEVSNSGMVALYMHLYENKKTNYVDLKAGGQVIAVSKEGKRTGFSEVKVSDEDFKKGARVSLKIALKNETLYIAGQETREGGYVAGVFPLNDLPDQGILQYKDAYVGLHLYNGEITVLDDGSFLFMTNEFYVQKGDPDKNQVTKYIGDHVEIVKFDKTGKHIFTKKIEANDVNYYDINSQCYTQKAYVVNGKIYIFINSSFGAVKCDDEVMKTAPGGDKRDKGALVTMNLDGSDLKNISMRIKGDISLLNFYSRDLEQLSDDTFFLPCKYHKKGNAAYLKVIIE